MNQTVPSKQISRSNRTFALGLLHLYYYEDEEELNLHLSLLLICPTTTFRLHVQKMFAIYLLMHNMSRAYSLGPDKNLSARTSLLAKFARDGKEKKKEKDRLPTGINLQLRSR